MIPYKRGDVVLIPFPFTDLSASKQRPALVVSHEAFHQAGSDIIVCAITSQSPTLVGSFDHLLSEEDLAQSGLPKVSKVKCGKLASLDHRIIRKKLGVLSPSTVAKIVSLIHRIIPPV